MNISSITFGHHTVCPDVFVKHKVETALEKSLQAAYPCNFAMLWTCSSSASRFCVVELEERLDLKATKHKYHFMFLVQAATVW